MGLVPFLDLVKLDQAEISRAKIRFHQKDPHDPLEVYLSDPNKINHEWLFWKSDVKQIFLIGSRDLAINFVQFSTDTWLLTTIKEIKSVPPAKPVGIERSDFVHLYGRLIVKYTKRGRNMDRLAKHFIQTLEVEQLLPQIYDGAGFPGYDHGNLVCCDNAQCNNFASPHTCDWRRKFSNFYLFSSWFDVTKLF